MGGTGNDVLRAAASGASTVLGGVGADTLTGAGNSYLAGGEVQGQHQFGFANSQTIEGGAGGDTMVGGGQVDWLSYASDTTGVVLNFISGVIQGGDATGDVIRSGLSRA